MPSSESLSNLRDTIVSVVEEHRDHDNLDDPTDHALVCAWNEVCESSPTVGIPEPIRPEDFR